MTNAVKYSLKYAKCSVYYSTNSSSKSSNIAVIEAAAAVTVAVAAAVAVGEQYINHSIMHSEYQYHACSVSFSMMYSFL